MSDNQAQPDKPGLRPYLTQTGAFGDGASSPRDFLEGCIAAIEAQEPAVGAFVVTNLDYSSTNGIMNSLIYVKATNDAAFFRVDGEQP